MVSDINCSKESTLTAKNEFILLKKKDIDLIHLKSEYKSLPWQRYNAYSHSQGDIILFIDDDILLEEGIN